MTVELNTKATPVLAEDFENVDNNDADYDEDDDVIEVHGGHAGEELVSHNLTFKPLYIMRPWKHRTTKDPRVSVALLLPTAIGENAGDIWVTIEDDEYLSVGMAWPSALTSPKMWTKKWLIGDRVVHSNKPLL